MEYRVIVLGNKQVGRTCFVEKFITGEFPEETEVTIEDKEYKKRVTIPGEEPCVIKVVDIAYLGADKLIANRGQAYILVFDLTDRTSFDELPLHVDRIRTANKYENGDTFPVCVVGNKVDVVNFKPNSRKVKKSEAERFCKSIGANKKLYFEVSARENINIELPFEHAVRALWAHLESSVNLKKSGDNCTIQ